MKTTFRNHILLVCCILSIFGCHTTKEKTSIGQLPLESPVLGFGTREALTVLLYKTRADYFNRVPVLMDAAKSRIVSYPAPSDLFYGDKPALPTRLKRGYLLDNRGIGPNVAFLTYTYETYGALKNVPEMSQLMDSLLDRNPLTELWDCSSGNQEKKTIEELNALIENGFPTCKQLQP